MTEKSANIDASGPDCLDKVSRALDAIEEDEPTAVSVSIEYGGEPDASAFEATLVGMTDEVKESFQEVALGADMLAINHRQPERGEQETEDDEREYRCDDCGESFETQEGFAGHSGSCDDELYIPREDSRSARILKVLNDSESRMTSRDVAPHIDGSHNDASRSLSNMHSRGLLERTSRADDETGKGWAYEYWVNESGVEAAEQL